MLCSHSPIRLAYARRAPLHPPSPSHQNPSKGALPAVRFAITASTVMTDAGSLPAGHACRRHRDRDRQRDRQSDRETETQTKRETERQRQRQRVRESETDSDR